MPNDLRFDGKVAIITGAGNGLGRSHALLLASRGARVLVNDLGGSAHGGGKSSAAADAVVEVIRAGGGEAAANYDSVEEGGRIVQAALDQFGRVDIVVNNAGILRDTTFHKMTEDDWDLVYRVHVLGAFRLTHAAWPHMRDQGYGRVVMTASAAGIYGNFGQANYAMAKLGLVGLSNTLALEGKKRNVHVNTVAPIAGSRLTETVLPKELVDALKPEYVSPLVAWLCHESCKENGGLFEVGGGFLAKLRWERAKGKTFRVGRPVTVEGIAGGWGEVTSFEETTHPVDIAQSMQPIMANLEAGPSRGSNEYIDVDEALGFEFPPIHSSYDERDLALYALGVGAADDPLDTKDLRYVYEMHADGLYPLPTYGVIPALNAVLELAKSGKQAPGLRYGFDRILHGEQYTELTRPLPPNAKLTHKARVKEIFDKGRHAIVVTEIKSYDEAGDLLVTNELTALVRGAGGFGGERGPTVELNVPPERAPDRTVTQKIGDNQALVYRLSGDWNPLHADPAFATAFGFKRPILHGLCTYGYAARQVIREFEGGDPRRFKSIKVRFSEPVYPGETLVTEMWKESDGRVVFRCKVEERDKVVLANAAIELYDAIPVSKAKPRAAAASAPAAQPAASAEPTSADIFTGIGRFLEQSPDLRAKVQTVYQFKLTDPASVWTLDVKGDKGVVAGGADKPDCTLELSDADFMGMCTGKLDAQKLYFGGKLKISGNVMASQKLEFLKRIDPALVLEAARARVGTGASAGPSAQPATPAAGGGAQAADGPVSADVFVAIADHVERHPELSTKIGTVFQFKLTEPESAWCLDLKTAPGAVRRGAADKADCTLELSDADFIGMASGKLDPQKLYFGGKLKISGNVMASQKLSFLQTIDPEQAKAAVAKARSAGAGAPTAAAQTTEARAAAAPRVFENLAARLATDPGIAAEVGALVAFHVGSAKAAWAVDLRGGGGVKAGPAPDAAATFTLSDDDLEALARGTEPVQRLFQQGKLRVDGDVRLGQKLGFLRGLLE